ncbi:MAG TPA: hypothetical protein VGF21_13965 [Thermoleophilaceae bacterium]
MAAVAVAIVAFVALSGGNDDNKNSSSGKSTGGTSTAPATQRIEIKEGKPVGGIHKITVTKGDTLHLVVSSNDTKQEIHMHGYDIARDMAPGHPAEFRVKTNIEGAFEIELEETSTKIANLQVRPD